MCVEQLPSLAWPIPRRSFIVAGAALAASFVAGCSNYRFGACSLYPAEVRTVAVPNFDATSYRRNLGERLTEAVVKEIELKTPYKVVNSAEADSVLTGRLVLDNKGVLLYQPTAESRNLQLNYQVEVTWVDRRGGQLRAPQTFPVPQSLATIDQPQNYIPEVGQSMATAQQMMIQKLADQIVGLMEAPW